MLIEEPPRRQSRENILPMINVVFLLLIFFLLSAELAPPEPFPVTPPDARTEDPTDGQLVLFMDQEGQLGFMGETGEDQSLTAFRAALAEFCDGAPCDETNRPPVVLRADRAAPGAAVAALLPKLGEMGLRDVELVTALK